MSNSCFYNIKDYGAIGDGITSDTDSIKKTINECAKKGGGTIVFPSGTYLTGPFQVYSNMTLYLDAGSIIFASIDINDYFITHTSFESDRIGLIYARDAKGISIIGKGTINCRGMSFMKNSAKPIHDVDKKVTRQKDEFKSLTCDVQDGPVMTKERPGNLIQFMHCDNVTLRDITVLDGPNWTIHFDDSENITVSGISIINNQLIPNSDGIHFTRCKYMRVSDCNIIAGDDCIALTGLNAQGKPSENLVVTNCILSSRSAGIRIGYGESDLSNCIFSNLVIHSNRGIGIFNRDKGDIRDIQFFNIIIHTRLHTGHWWGHGEPIHISTESNGETETIGKIQNIQFSNITAYSETGILVCGCKESLIENLSFDNIKVNIVPSKLSDSYGGNFDLRPTSKFKTAFFAHDEYGLFAKHVNSFEIRNLQINWKEKIADYFNDAARFENCNNLIIDGYKGRQPHKEGSGAAIAICDCHDISIINSIADEGTNTFLRHSNISGKGLFSSNNLSKAKVVSNNESLPFKEYGNLLPN